ncbi:MAG: conserved phage C-terminal domain-containing protein, partial [Bacilli bacterium]|nr:conserved phage C-terminal domain-containing protein [Bacilli bacterium]
MNYNFKKLNTKVLSFDPVNDIEKILFNHYIMRLENKNRLTKKLEDGQFKMTIRSVSSDLNFSRGKVERLIKYFEELEIIRVVFKGNSSSRYSIYEYVTQDKNDNNKFKNLSETVIETLDESVNETVICKYKKSSKPNEINGCTYNFDKGNLDDFETVVETVSETDDKNSKIDNINIYLNNNIYNSVIDYLNKKAKKRFKSNTPKTKRLINTRLKEGFLEED